MANKFFSPRSWREYEFRSPKERDRSSAAFVRLCRPMCGRAVPFRLELLEFGAPPQLGGEAPEIRAPRPVGRSRHRTSGGEAAITGGWDASPGAGAFFAAEGQNLIQ